MRKNFLTIFLFSFVVTLLGCTKIQLVESSSPTEPVTYKSIKIAKFKKLDYYYESTVPCSEVAFLKSYAGMPNIGLFIDNILDIHKQEIEETKSLGFIVLNKVYKCTFWGLGVEYALDK
mgnify:FL=1